MLLNNPNWNFKNKFDNFERKFNITMKKIIAEIGSSHDGSFGNAMKLIEEAKKWVDFEISHHS